jgi:hypothetical protein
MKRFDLTKMTHFDFGRLTPLHVDPATSKWVCRCTCGNVTSVAATHLINKRVKSCGCLRRENMIVYHRKIKELNNEATS